jgi:5'-nucleotidase
MEEVEEKAPQIPLKRGIFCNRTLNMRSLKAIGYDMDYTLVHYHVDEWEGQAYSHMQRRLIEQGWPVAELRFDAKTATRGLVLDVELGNLLKVNRFGYVKRACHGTKQLEYRAMRKAYASTVVDLSLPRFQFLNTFFSISEACMYAQLVDLLDDGRAPTVLSYVGLYGRVRDALDAAHVEGVLKAEIMSAPERYVHLDPEMPQALLDQQEAGKRLMLITNSEWEYTRFMMSWAVDPFLPEGKTWRDLFEIVVVSARKPAFFAGSSPMLEIVDEDAGTMRPFVGPLERGKVYFGGTAAKIEEYVDAPGDQILYVGDHIFTDVNVSKSLLRWRTALILRELEEELEEVEAAQETQKRIHQMMVLKEELEDRYSLLRLDLQRTVAGYGEVSGATPEELRHQMHDLRERLVALDNEIAPLVMEDGKRFNDSWGYLMRSGNDKSHFTRQIERYADIYTSRVSNFLRYTPFVYFRSPRGSMPHDPGV